MHLLFLVVSNPQKEEEKKTTFIWKEPNLAANLEDLEVATICQQPQKSWTFHLILTYDDIKASECQVLYATFMTN